LSLLAEGDAVLVDSLTIIEVENRAQWHCLTRRVSTYLVSFYRGRAAIRVLQALFAMDNDIERLQAAELVTANSCIRLRSHTQYLHALCIICYFMCGRIPVNVWFNAHSDHLEGASITSDEFTKAKKYGGICGGLWHIPSNRIQIFQRSK